MNGIIRLLASEESDFGFLNSGSDMGKWSTIGNAAKNVESSGFQLIFHIGISALIIGVMVAGICLIISGNGNVQSEVKERIKWVVLGGVALFCASSLVLLAVKLGQTF